MQIFALSKRAEHEVIIIESMLFSFSLFAEIEAKEACDWLRAAGFPQYVQLFKGKYEAVSFIPPAPHGPQSQRRDDTGDDLRRRLIVSFVLLCASDCRFPIDVEWAKRDHHFLDEDALDSLCR